MNTYRPVAQKQYILFTWSKCSQCKELKPRVRQLVQSGRIKEYDLDAIHSNPSLFGLFQSASPNNNIPVLVILNQGRMESKYQGLSPILRALGL